MLSACVEETAQPGGSAKPPRAAAGTLSDATFASFSESAMKAKSIAPSGEILRHLETVRNFTFDQKVDLTRARLDLSTGEQIKRLCGTADDPLGETPSLDTAQQVKAYYSGVIGTIGDRADCWAARYPNIQADRDVELAFFEVMGKDLVKQRDAGTYSTSKSKEELRVDFNVIRDQLKYSLTNDAALKYEMAKFQNPEKTIAVLQRHAANSYERIAYWKSVKAQRRQATLDALAGAIVAVANDNPMTRRGPGQNLTSYAPTSRISNSRYPALNPALNTLDRTVYGQQTYSNQMRRDAMAMARTNSSGSVITLRNHNPCSYSIPGRDCVSQEEFTAYNQRQHALEAQATRTRTQAEMAAVRAQAARIEAAGRAAAAARQGPAVAQ
jgi:hypothetical protein